MSEITINSEGYTFILADGASVSNTFDLNVLVYDREDVLYDGSLGEMPRDLSIHLLPKLAAELRRRLESVVVEEPEEPHFSRRTLEDIAQDPTIKKADMFELVDSDNKPFKGRRLVVEFDLIDIVIPGKDDGNKYQPVTLNVRNPQGNLFEVPGALFGLHFYVTRGAYKGDK